MQKITTFLNLQRPGRRSGQLLCVHFQNAVSLALPPARMKTFSATFQIDGQNLRAQRRSIFQLADAFRSSSIAKGRTKSITFWEN